MKMQAQADQTPNRDLECFGSPKGVGKFQGGLRKPTSSTNFKPNMHDLKYEQRLPKDSTPQCLEPPGGP